MKKLTDITDIKKATIIYCKNKDMTETFLQLDGEEEDDAHEIIWDYGCYLDNEDSYIKIDGVPYFFNEDDVINTKTATEEFFRY